MLKSVKVLQFIFSLNKDNYLESFQVRKVEHPHHSKQKYPIITKTGYHNKDGEHHIKRSKLFKSISGHRVCRNEKSVLNRFKTPIHNKDGFITKDYLIV
jgi:hypothetical protein